MRTRQRLGSTLGALALLAASCSGGPSDAERAACEAGEGLLTATDRQALRARIRSMVSESEQAGNRSLEDASRSYEDALDKRDEAGAAAAIGRFYDECQRLGLAVPGEPAQ